MGGYAARYDRPRVSQAVTRFKVCSMIRLAVEFTFLPNPVDIGFVGTGSAVGGVVGGLLAFMSGLDLEETATQAGNAAVAVGTFALTIWAMGMLGLELGV
jgi:hypothetical protein